MAINLVTTFKPLVDEKFALAEGLCPGSTFRVGVGGLVFIHLEYLRLTYPLKLADRRKWAVIPSLERQWAFLDKKGSSNKWLSIS